MIALVVKGSNSTGCPDPGETWHLLNLISVVLFKK